MKKLLIFLVLVGYTSLNYSQTLIQTFTDRCTGATQVFQIAMSGSTTVVFYDRARAFTAADVQSGIFQAWLEETYLWWSTLNPCSAAQAETTTAQQTAQQTTQAATQAAASAASSPPPQVDPPTTSTAATEAPPAQGTTESANTQSTNETTTEQTSSGGNNTEEQSTGSPESESSEGQGTEGETSDNGEDSPDGEEPEETEEVKKEEKSDEESDESKEEKSEEEKDEKESEDEDSEEDEEKDSEKESDDEDEEEGGKDKKKKRNLAPPVLASNLMSMQMLDGSWSTAASFGLSQSSLTGQETYSVNTSIWSNFKQFSLGVSKSKIRLWNDYQNYAEVIQHNGTRRVTQGDPKKQNTIHHVGSTSFNFMYIYGTKVFSGGYSHVILGQQDNFWKGFAGGYAATSSVIILPGTVMVSPSLTLFGTKPVKFQALPRWGFGPMVALSYSPIQISRTKNEYGKDQFSNKWNKYMSYILGTNVNFSLTQRFVANLGVNTMNSTDPIIPTSFAVTIGARFAF